jgi:aminopeptidase N
VGGKRADAAIASFYQRFSDEPLVVNQWFQLQAMNPYGNAIDRVKSLLAHPAYDPLNPNKIRSVIGAFSQANPVQFHSADGQGYALLADIVIELNEKNPQIASRLLAPLTKWRTYPAQSAGMRAELERIAGQPTLSKDVFEVVSKSLAV